MAFKLRQPIKIDPVARYEVPFTPDNIPDGSGLVARANDNGNMIVNKNIPRNGQNPPCNSQDSNMLNKTCVVGGVEALNVELSICVQ